MDVAPIDYGLQRNKFNAFGMIVNIIIILFFIYIKKYFNLFIYGEEGPFIKNDSKMKPTKTISKNIRIVESYISRV